MGDFFAVGESLESLGPNDWEGIEANLFKYFAYIFRYSSLWKGSPSRKATTKIQAISGLIEKIKHLKLCAKKKKKE